jgi:OsmC-like protein
VIKPLFEGVRASANPAYQGNERCVDPEEAYVSSLSSCHMLTFLAIARKKRITVDGYQDQAVGILEKDRAPSHEGPSKPRDSTHHPRSPMPRNECRPVVGTLWPALRSPRMISSHTRVPKASCNPPSQNDHAGAGHGHFDGSEGVPVTRVNIAKERYPAAQPGCSEK